MTTTYLDRIVAAHRAAAAEDHRDEGDLEEAAERAEPARGFRAALAQPGLAVIAEVKRRSPSKGDLFPELDPAVLAQQYVAGGAACLSVLTDEDWFGGSRDDLRAARAAVPVPVLRKDFTVSRNDVCDARLMGADAVLLIVAALGQDELVDLHALAVAVGLDVLVEVHDEDELIRALDAGATLVGVNQRDLVTFEVDLDRAARVRPLIPEGVVAVAESGIGGPQDAARAAADGYDAVLVGESLVRSGDPSGAARALVDAGASGRPEPLPFGE
jgi:indole-3-glycerol phosphate synthase